MLFINLTSFCYRFKVDSKSGEVRVAVAADENFALIDRENRDLMRDLQSLTVEARDGGGTTSTVKVIVDLIDQNDNVPIIESNEYTGTVRENAAQLDKPVIITVGKFSLRNWLEKIKFTNDILQNLLLIRIMEFSMCCSYFQEVLFILLL